MGDHVKLREGGNITGVLCVDREIGSCIILQASIDEVDKLLGIAQARGVPHTMIVVPAGVVDELKRKGWKVTDYVTMYHD